MPGHPETSSASAGNDGLTPARISSRDLLGGNERLIIDHGGETYYLKRTRQGKLILTK
jgi:hemin uptake protein HemP